MRTAPESRQAILRRRKVIFETKIAQEEYALAHGGMLVASPAEYKTVLGQSRSDRLADWRAILSRINQELVPDERLV